MNGEKERCKTAFGDGGGSGVTGRNGIDGLQYGKYGKKHPHGYAG